MWVDGARSGTKHAEPYLPWENNGSSPRHGAGTAETLIGGDIRLKKANNSSLILDSHHHFGILNDSSFPDASLVRSDCDDILVAGLLQCVLDQRFLINVAIHLVIRYIWFQTLFCDKRGKNYNAVCKSTS